MGQVIMLGAILLAIILSMGLTAMDRHEYRLALKKIEKEAEESRKNFRLQTIELWQKAALNSAMKARSWIYNERKGCLTYSKKP